MSRPPAQRRRSRLIVVLLPLVGLLAGAAIAIALVQALAKNAPSATAQAAEQHQTQGVVLVASDYVGRPIEDVAGQLAAFGLTVQRRIDISPPHAAVPGTVTGVDPTGVQLRPGSVVVVRYVAPLSTSLSGGASGVTETALTRSATPPTSVAPSSRAAAASTGAPTSTGAPATTALAGSSSASASASASRSPSASSSPAGSSSPSNTSSPASSSSSTGP